MMEQKVVRFADGVDYDEYERGQCDKCGFVVKLHDHELRCRVKDRHLADIQRKLAWFGDNVHSYVVRWCIIKSAVPLENTQIVAEKFVGRTHQAQFYKDYVAMKDEVLGSSLHSVATAFESSFILHSEFRIQYVKLLFNEFGLQVDSIEFYSLMDVVDSMIRVVRII